MKIDTNHPPRYFRTGSSNQVTIADCGKIHLEPHEMISFVTTSGKEYDVGARSWGFYATPSLNDRLKKEGFKTALVKNPLGKVYVMIVEQDQVSHFERYLKEEKNELIEWLDERR